MDPRDEPTRPIGVVTTKVCQILPNTPYGTV